MTLARQCRQSGRLWEDPAFPANSKVLTDGNMIVSYFGRRQVDPLDFISASIITTIGKSNNQDDHVQVRDNEIQWLRPRDICKAMNLRVSPAMIVGERDR